MAKEPEDILSPCGHRNSERIEAAKKLPSGICPACLLERINGLETQLEQHRWIPVSERLPKKGNYLALYDDSEQRLIYEVGFISGKWYSMTGHEISFITHWMPIILP